MMPSYLLNHLWQSTLFVAAAGLLTLAFKENRAPVRYWLWFAASCKFLIPFSLLVTLGSQFEWRTAPVADQLPFVTVVEEISQPAGPPAPLPRLASVAPAPSRGPAVLLGVWLGGLVVVVFAWARQWWSVRTALRSASPLDLNLPIRVVSSPARLEPGVFGVFRPILLLPNGIIERLTPSQWEAILAHELCHVRRRDNLTAAVHMMVEAIFWFHPLVWWIGKRLVDERERACDEEVLLTAGDPQNYAEAILNVCKLYVESPLVCVSGVTGSNLKKRIRAIMTERVAGDLNFAKKLALAVAGMAVLALPIVVGMFNAPPLHAQSAAAPTPKFEVASVRPCGDGRAGGQNGRLSPPPIVSPGRLNTGCSALAGSPPLAGLIQRAYGRLGLGHPVSVGSALPISDGPSWIYSDYYVINATAAGNASEETMEGPMLQALLEDRFKLKAHRATREVPVYALTVGKSGSKLQPAAEGTCPPPGSSTPPLLLPGRKVCNDFMIGRKGANTTMAADEATVDYLTKLLGLVLDRPVINKTGLSGRYDFHLEFAIDQTTPGALPEFGPTSDEPPGASVFTVVQEQLGLKLEATKGPREFLVVDQIERPSEN